MTRILDQHGNPIEKSTLSAPQTAGLTWLKREIESHPARGLTAKRLAAILNEAEHGDIQRQCELMEDMEERDAHLYAELAKRQRAILTVDWTIQPPSNASAAEKVLAGEIEDILKDMDEFQDVLLGCANAIGRGFACQEIEWELLGGRDWMPKRIDFRPQTWFTLDRDTRTQIMLRATGTVAEPLQPFGWIVHQHKAKPGYIARGGLHRQLAWPYLFKNYAVGDMAEFLEIHGLPLRVGTYPSTATQEEKATLLRAVANIGHDAAGIIPEGMMIEFKEAMDAGHEPFEAMIAWAERSMSKAILGGTLTSQADGKSSTNALGKVHDEVRHDLLESDAKQIAATLRRDLLFPLAALRGKASDPRRIPRLVFDTQEYEDFKLMAESLPKFVDMGMRIPMDYAHEATGIPKASDDEEVLQKAAKPAPVPPTGNVKPGQPAPNDQDADELAKAEADKAALKQRGLHAIATLFNQAEAAAFPDQAALDAAINQLPADQLQAHVDAIMAPIISAIRDGESIEDVLTRLAGLYPSMDATGLQSKLEQAMFVADLWGRLSAQQETAENA